MCCSAVPFLSWGALPLLPFFSDTHTTSACLKLPPIPYSPSSGILSVHTFHTPHMTLSPPSYTTPALTGTSCLEYPLHSAPVPSIVECTPYSSSTLFVTTSCFLIILSFMSHCITLLVNTSNLFWRAVPLSSFPSLFLQFQTRYPNPLQFQHSHSFFPSNFALNEVRAHFCLSKLLINELYCCKDIVLYLCKGMEVMLILVNYHYVCWGARSSSPSQVPTALLTTALIIGLNYHLKERILTLDSLLEVTITPLYVPLTVECNTRFLLRKQ